MSFSTFLFKSVRVLISPFVKLNAKIENRICAYYKHKEQEKEIPVFSTCNPRDKFFEKIKCITHAGGGLAGLNYLNCEQAFPFYYQQGNKVFEYDVIVNEEHEFILAHDESAMAQDLLDERFTPLSILKCLKNVEDNKDLVVIFDCKIRDLTEFAEFIKGNLSQEALDRVVIQVFNEENIEQVRKVYNFKILYVCMMNTDYMEVIKTCIKHNVGAVSIADKAIKNRVGFEVFEKNNVCTFIYTINTLKDYRRVRDLGMTGVFSDFLLDVEIENIGSTK